MKTTQLNFKVLDRSQIVFLSNDFKRDDLLYNVMQAGHVYPVRGYRIMRSGYEAYMLASVHAGRLDIYYDGKRYAAGPGDFIFFDQRHPHIFTDAYDETVDMHFMYLFGGDGIKRVFEKSFDLFGCVIESFCPDGFDETVDKICRDMKAGTQDEYEISAALYSVLINIAKHVKTNTPSADLCDYDIADIVKYVREHYAQDIKLDELAKMFFIDKFGMIRKFHKRTGYTPKEYQNNLRFNAACRMLTDSDMTVSDIAREVGFCDARGLIGMFARRMDCSPLQYRRNSRNMQ